MPKRSRRTISLEDRVRQAVETCGKSQRTLATEAGLTQASVSYFAKSGMHLGGDKLEKLANAAGLTIECTEVTTE